MELSPRTRKATRWAGIGAGALFVCAAVGLLVLALTCPPVEALRDYRPPQASLVFDRDGKLLARLAPEERIVVPLTAMSPMLTGAFLAIEDQRFYEHSGIDWHRVFGALWRDIKTLSAREGSSTITMQLARNVFPDRLTRARTLRRKLAEMIVARRIERVFSKQQILEMYLNQIYLGNGYYGVEAAARGYFGKPSADLTAPQAALLAALPKAPANYDPRRAPDQALKRRNLVLAQMLKANLITAKDEVAALHTKIRLVPPEQEGGAPWFVAEVRRELRQMFGPEAEIMGLRVRTPLDPTLQKAAERELTRQIQLAESGKLGKLAVQRCGADHDQCLEGMFVALDAHTGDVVALVGGRDYQQSQFDRATQARRQPGSAFKPFVWAAALENGIPATTLLDTTAVPLGDYQPADGQAAMDHPLTLREALRISSNRAALALGQKVGLQPVSDVARACGIEDPIPPWPSTFLGAAEVTPLSLVAAFAPFANGGERIQPRFLDEVKSATGEVLFTETIESWQAMPPQVSFIMASLLEDVVDHGTGVGARAQLPSGLPALGKTGTTNGAQDVWFVGATPELVAGVWMGFDKPRPLGAAATGGRLAAPVWGRVVAAWEKGREIPADWQPPEGVEPHDIDVRTGGRANAGCPQEQVVREWFAQGTVPEECAEHQGGLSGFLERTFGRIFR